MIIRKILCKLGFHKYDEYNHKIDSQGYLWSKCKFCKCSLIYNGKGEWFKDEC